MHLKKGEQVSIIDNINKQLKFDKDEVYPGGKEIIKQIVEKAPIQLPADYYEFLSCISGTGNIGSIEFEIESDDEDIGNIPICLWSANRALSMQNEFAHSMKENFISKVWFIGDDLGDMVYFYGFGNDGFGVYFVEAGSLGFEYAYKIADTLTDFLVNGAGIDVIESL